MSPQGSESEIVNEARATALLQTFARSFRRNAPQVFREFGEEKSTEFVDEMKFKISAQLFHHHPLNREYYIGKIKMHQDPRILIRTGEYLEGITHEEVEEAGSVVFRCGMRSGLHRSSGLPIRLLQKFLEQGTSRMPARPHWRPMIVEWQSRSNELGRELRSKLANRIAQDLG